MVLAALVGAWLIRAAYFRSGKSLLQRTWHAMFVQVLLVCFCASIGHAQLAQSFITVTGITTRKLPNAVQIRIETDGSVRFGFDQSDFIDIDGGFTPKPTQSIRIRIWRARAKLPAFVPIEAYPVDGAVVSLGREDLSNPAYEEEMGSDADPRVEVELRFATPVIIRQFRDFDFGEFLGPLEASVDFSNDRRAIVITVITDRADATAPRRLDRSPLAGRKHSLQVEAGSEGHFSLKALHSPLGDVLNSVSAATANKFLTRGEIASQDISMVLSETTIAGFLQALEIGYGVGARTEGGTFVLGRGDEFYASRTLQLNNLTPEKTRLLFPDFLLPSLRAQRENNALLAVQTPPMLDKISADLAKLDVSRPQFEIRVEAWEIASTRDLNQTIALTRSVGGDTETLDLGTGTSSVRVESGLTNKLSAQLNLLSSQGRANLVASPHVTALSGEAGTLFLGQTRYIKVLQNTYNGQTARALPLQIGTTLSVTPRGNDQDGDILLAVNPRISTVDAIEAVTGLPTVGIREASSNVRVRPGDSVVLAGLDFDFDSKTGGRALKVVPSKRGSREKRQLLVLVTAQRVGSATIPGSLDILKSDVFSSVSSSSNSKNSKERDKNSR